MTYRQGDVRDRAALEEAFEGADVVAHLPFMITGAASREAVRQINFEGTLNAFRAAAAAGARRFVYASSVAAYGFHRDDPVGMTEDWPARPAAHLFYAQEKAEIERLLEEEAAGHPGLGLYLLRPPIVLGPDAVGAKSFVPRPLTPLVRWIVGLAGRLPLPVITLPVPIQFIHVDDVGQAFPDPSWCRSCRLAPTSPVPKPSAPGDPLSEVGATRCPGEARPRSSRLASSVLRGRLRRPAAQEGR